MTSVLKPRGRVVVEEDSHYDNATAIASPAEADAVCPNCGAGVSGRFCANCGERRIAGEDYSLRRFLGEAFNILTSVESNLFRSFAALVARPGHLTAEYFRGRRKSYLKPLQLFVFCNILFFFVQSYAGFNSLTTPLYVHLHMLPYSTRARAMVEERLQERKISYDEYRSRFDNAIGGQAKTLVIVLVPIFALPLLVLYWRARRYYVEHLVFSTHFFAFFLLLLPALHIITFILVRSLYAARGIKFRLLEHDTFLTMVMLFFCGVYLWVALRRVYGQGKLMTTIKCFALVACIMSVIQLYRFILFFTTFYSI
jgi:hypothetical protein